MNTTTPQPQRIRTRLRKISASFFIALTLLSPTAFVGVGTTAVVLATPQPVYAGLPTLVDFSVPDALKLVLDFVVEGLVGAAKVGIKNALRSFLEKIAYDTAVWIGSGDENQKPLLFTDDVGTYLQEAGDAALGEVLNTMASENGFINLNLCDLPSLEKLKFQLILPQLLAAEPAEPNCTFSELTQSVSDYAENLNEQAQAFMDDPRSLVDFSASLDSGSNALSSLMDTVDTAIGAKTEAERKAEIERQKSDFKDKTASISNYIQTPAGVIAYQTQATINQSTQGETIQQDNILADALGVFVNTLSSKLLERATTGLLSFFTETDISESVSGSSAVGSAGIQGAEEQFASFKTPSFTTGGTIDILTQFASCPEEGADVVNCVLDENFRLAIEEGLTVQEAIDQGILDGATAFGFGSDGAEITDPTSGISLRNMRILKQYSVIPVGWVLAAEYNRDFDGAALTLQEVVDNFDHCTTSDYSPYCGLVDPAWVLKAPDVFCKVQGYGENLATTTFIDNDGNDYTPEEELVSRLSSCLDSQSCLTEDDSGNCLAYGYCTEQRDIYRFEGDSCPSYQASCELFTDADDSEVSYLKNTLNYNDCSSDNAGCQWYCTQYNEVDDAFRCAGEGLMYTECSTDGGCTCTDSDTSETCTVSNGGFQCTTDSGANCTLGTETDATSGVDSAISFDNDVESCDSNDAGCSEFIEVNGGENVLFNGSFENFNSYQELTEDALDELAEVSDDSATSPYDDTFGFYGETGDGEPCSATGTDTCYGWEFLSGATARAVTDSLYGSVAMQMADTGSGSGYVSAAFETGQALENRSFVLSFNYVNPATSSCSGEYWIRPDGSTTPAAVAVTYSAGGTYSEVVSDPITFDDAITTTKVRIGITQPAGCALIIDGVKLEENNGNSGFTDYAYDPIYINIANATSCTAAEVGCEMYTPVTGESTLDIPGIITNPLSDVCDNGDDFSNPSCSQCDEQYVGCESYIPQENAYSVPIKDVGGFDDPLDASAEFTALANAIATRTGYYCEGTETACSPEREALQCGASSCLPELSIVPTTGTSCSAANVGCEEYVNLQEQESGGEGLEYYTYVRQCVQPTDDQISADEVQTYYTFEGSDVSGYQIRSWYLKASDDVDANGYSAPCTNLDVYGDSAETVAAECIDVDVGEQDCDASDVGDNPDCTEYYDDAGNVYYRLASATISVDEDCQAMRNTLDDRIYYTIPDESTSCPASANLCTEFKGSKGNSVQTIVEDDFDSGAWDGGESSSTVITANTGLSMAIGTATTSGSMQAYTDVSSLLDADSSYIITFWAKADTNGAIIDPYFASASAGTTSYVEESGVTLNTEWKAYTAGPFVYGEELANDEVFGLEYTGATVYVDNVNVSESSSYYLIRGTSDLCPGYEGCEEYKNTDGDTHYLKSFTSLCDENVVGCEALIDTNNSDTPFFQNYNDDNEYTEDDVPVSQDTVVTYAVTDGVLCSSDKASCTHMGQPTLDEEGAVTEFADAYLLNDPDDYDTSLCQEQQLQCEEFAAADGSTVYFKDPGEKVCSYDSGTGAWLTPDGDSCPLQNENGGAAPSQPKGPICNGGVRSGELCSSDSDCPAASGDSNIYRCSSDLSQDSGWAGSCSQQYSGCTEYIDPEPNSELSNGNFETDIETNDDITAGVADGIPDDWNQLNEGDSGSGSFSATSITYTDITSATVDTAFDDDYELSFWSDADFTGSGQILSGFFAAGATSFTDGSGNPSSNDEMLVGTSSVYWNGWTSERIVSVTTNTGTYTITVPVVSDSALADYFMVFHVDTDGNLYWADTGHDGVKADKSDYIAASSALTEDNLVSSSAVISSFEVNAFYDMEADGGTVGCTTFAQATSPTFDREASLELQANSASYSHCMVSNSEIVEVDENEEYTLSGNVYLEDSTDTDQFAIGLLYYDADGNEIGSSTDPEAYAIAAYEGGDRSDTTLSSGQWLRFYGAIGPNLTHEFPDGTYFVRTFIEVANTGTDTSVFFDNVTFGQNDAYTYVNTTVDGATESDSNSCSGTIDPDGGCVAFRDTTSNELTYLGSVNDETAVNSSFTVDPCTFNSGVDDEECNSTPNAADANSVIQVRNDRECSQWLTCTDSRPNYDDAGNLTSTTCFQIGSCVKRNEDTGVCTEYAPTVSSDVVGYDDDISATSQPGNVDDLLDIQYYSGYVDAGVEWNGTCVSSACVGGASEGASCSTDSDCDDPNIEYGYYPEDWMVERGEGGAQSTSDIVEDGDFEAVYCDGGSDYDFEGSLSFSASQAQAVENARDKTLSCTRDTQCRTTDTESKVKSTLEENESTQDIENISYSDGWCANFETSASTSWTGTSGTWYTTGSADASIIDYDPTVDFTTGDDGVGASNLDLNNVLLVGPANNAASGIATGLDADDVIQGQEYTISFDAQYTGTPDSTTDFMQIGLTHGTDDSNTDFFEVGTPMADVVFIVDASSSMETYITRVASATSSFVTSLENAGIDYQTAIVTTGDDRTPRPLDFSDYTGGSGTDYGATDGITTDFTTSASTFSAAMTQIAGDLDGGGAYNYEGLVDLANNSFDIGTGTDVSLNFRPGAVKFVILLTDVAPEGGDDHITGNSSTSWEEDDEDDLITTLGTPYILYAITATSASAAYDDLVAQLGGTTDSISSSSYSALLTAISESMADRVAAFSFDTTYHRYTLGPITIENKDDVTATSVLFIRQTEDSSNVSFVVDNVSLLPALEVNQENNPDAADSSWLISRDCRGYPAQDSLFCNYTDDNGAIYTGWKGYCMQHDDYDSKKCIAWWPIDIISGEPDSTARTKVQYTGRYPVYQCLAAKGVEELHVCENDGGEGGKFCDSDADCGSGGTCVETYTNVIKAPTGGGSGSWDNDPQNVFSSADSISSYYSDLTDHYKAVPRHLHLYSTGAGVGSDGDGQILVVPANAVEKAITLSDVTDLKLNFNAISDANTDEWMPEGETFSLASEYTAVSASSSPDGRSGEKCYDVDFLEDGNSTDITFVWSVVADNSDYVDGDGNPNNPYCGGNGGPDLFEALEDRTDDTCSGGGGGCNFSDSDLNEWEASVGDNDTANNQSDDFDTYAWTGDNGINDTQADDAYGTDEKTYFKDQTNVFAVYLDFNDEGILDNSRYMFWSSIADDGINFNLNVEWYLQETCVAAVQTVDESANTTPWMGRLTSTSDYELYGLGYTYDTPTAPYGGIAALDNTPDTSDWDGSSNGTETFFTTGNSALPISNNSTSSGGSPYSCVGNCSGSYCTGDGTTSCSSDSDCSSNGFCTGVQSTAVAAANSNGDQSSDNQGNTVDSYDDQVYAAALEARDRLKLLFADLTSEAYIRLEDENFYTAASSSSASSRWSNLWLDSSGGTDIFTGMDTCTDADQETNDYCGIRPTVDTILVNGNESGDLSLQNGETVSLTFNSDVDDDQQPLQTIRIVWNGSTTERAFTSETIDVTDPWEAASTTGHSYTHAYSCDPTSSYWNDEAYACEYKVKIQIEDNWSFCSGNTRTNTTRGLTSSCTSYDEYDGIISVAP